jgi:hypothetical protein
MPSMHLEIPIPIAFASFSLASKSICMKRMLMGEISEQNLWINIMMLSNHHERSLRIEVPLAAAYGRRCMFLMATDRETVSISEAEQMRKRFA